METVNKEVMEQVVSKKPVTEKFKTEKCRVLHYDKQLKTLDISFKGYGIRFNNVNGDIGDLVEVKYRGKIGTPGFVYKL